MQEGGQSRQRLEIVLPMPPPDKRYLEGLQALTNGDYTKAEEFLREVVTATPDHADAVANLGYILDQRGLIDEGERFLRQAIQLEFPDFVNKLTLLVNAGLTVTKAWEKAAMDSRRQTPLYRELCTAVQAVRSGISEYKAYQEFAKRCHVPAVTRFVTVVLQNIRKGNSELVPVLRLLADECWEMRKNAARKLGEEASTRLLLPMMLMFIAILLIVGMPAVLALRNI